MTRDVVNFNAGPAGLPRPALERARDELLDFAGTGMSILEHSHRGKVYEAVHQEAKDRLRRVLGVPDSHEILFLQGGASQLFATVPMNFLLPGRSADYILTGLWSEKAFDEAQRVGAARIAASGAREGRFVHIPTQSELQLDPAAAYVHYTTNNTVAGTQWRERPETGAVPLVADASSDILSRPMEVSRHALIYAGAQKNVGPSGLVVAIIEKSFIARASTAIPTIFRFKTHADNDSLYNTPPTFSIYLVRNVLAWLEDEGGLPAIEARNDEKARRLYAAIDGSGGFYRSPVEVEARSKMNVVFRLPTEALEDRFVKESTAAGLEGLKGHRSVGGLRASIYNAVSLNGVERLIAFMQDFMQKHG